jgi:hypothetical protein
VKLPHSSVLIYPIQPGKLFAPANSNASRSQYNLSPMKTLLLATTLRFTPILAATLIEGVSSALGIVMLIGFIFGTICVISGGFAIRRGDTDSGKLSIIGGLIIAGAPVIVKALFVSFGLGSSTADVGTFQ